MRNARLFGVAAAVAGLAGQAAAQDRPLAAEFEEVYRVGGMNAPEWAFFRGAEPAGFDGAGNLYIMDGQESQVVIIDAAGELVRTVGREGEGPGEFNSVSGFWVWREGGFVVQDLGHAAYQVFGPSGELERFVRMGEQAAPLAMVSGMRFRVRAHPAGGALIAQGMPPAIGGMVAGLFDAFAEITGEAVGDPEPAVDDRGLERIDLTGDAMSVSPVLQARRLQPEKARETVDLEDLMSPANLIGLAADMRYFEPGFHWDVLPDGTIAYSDSSDYAITLAGPGGSVVRVLRRPLSPEPVTDRIRRRAIDHAVGELEAEENDDRIDEVAGILGRAMVESMTKELREQAEAREFYPEIPVVEGLRATWGGALWIQRRGEDPLDARGPIDVFGADGEYAGTFAAEDAEMPVAFGPGGLVLFWEFDEMDVPTIVVKRLPAGVR